MIEPIENAALWRAGMVRARPAWRLMASATTVIKERGTKARTGRTKTGRSSNERPDREIDGDASQHLEELVVGPLAPTVAKPIVGSAIQIELIGPHLRVAGTMSIGYHRRLSDFVNHHVGLLELRDATVLRRNGDPTRVTTPSIWVSPDEVTLMGQAVEDRPDDDTGQEMHVQKAVHTLIAVTPGHTLTGDVHISEGAELARYIESPEPLFIPMTDVRTRSLADRRIIARYAFALLNRRHMVAATELQPGMIPGRTVL